LFRSSGMDHMVNSMGGSEGDDMKTYHELQAVPFNTEPDSISDVSEEMQCEYPLLLDICLWFC
ncbi:MAG: hypothetical protein MJA29_00795, partial [Candidatus Omnitrophica bacterium]|nr:hypothetical protein [Candidatus Omnitrophota bacterium]